MVHVICEDSFGRTTSPRSHYHQQGFGHNAALVRRRTQGGILSPTGAKHHWKKSVSIPQAYLEHWEKWVSWGQAHHLFVHPPINPAHFSRYLDFLYHQQQVSLQIIQDVCLAANYLQHAEGYDHTIGKTCYMMFLKRNDIQPQEHQVYQEEALSGCKSSLHTEDDSSPSVFPEMSLERQSEVPALSVQ